jgi:hypothetical protein
MRTALAAAGVASALVFSASVHAQAPVTKRDRAMAQQLFKEGRQLMKAGQFDVACDKLAASQKADPSPGTLLNLARCHEMQGKTATAWAEYNDAAALAKAMNRRKQQKLASRQAASLEPKLSKLTIEASGGEPELVVERDGVEVPAAVLGQALTVDPGEHTIDARAPGYESWSTTIQVPADGAMEAVTVPPLTKEAVPPPDVGEPDSGSLFTTGQWVGIGMGGLGVVAAGVGVVFGVMASSQFDDATADPALCADDSCTPAGREEIDAVETKGTVATLGISIGATLAVAGTVLFFTTGDDASDAVDDSEEGEFAVLPWAGPTGGGLGLVGSF